MDSAELALTSPLLVMVAALVPNTLDDSELMIELLSELVALDNVLSKV
jgi:hypothetical protein